MPAKIHGEKVDEDLWKKARAEAAKSYDPETERHKFYGTLMIIYKKMKQAKE